ncbi:MAG: DNA polymerase I, partial [Candidatus Omnitrophica bacterium]|nr:DNA polymerase I [Candidatus Omnitrophota bacterium]
PIFEVQGYEADDVLATIAKKAESHGIETYIVTGDKDALQLVNDHIKVFSTHKDGLIYDKAKVREAYGVGPEKIPDIMALMGDASDNIPGVRGIGEKTAIELIGEFGSLDHLLANISKVKGEARQKMLREGQDMARLSKELALLDKDVPLKVDFKQLELKEPDQASLLELYKELEFKSFIKDLTPKETLRSTYELIDSQKKLEKLVSELGKIDEFAFDFETTNEDPMVAAPVGVSFSWKIGHACYVPMNKHFDANTVLSALKRVFENRKVLKIGQNIKYEYMILAKRGIRLGGELFDTMVASYVLNPSKLNHNLEDISIEYLNHKMTTPIDDLIGKGKKAITMAEVDVEKVCAYCCEDSDVTLRLKKILEKEISAKGLEELFYKVEMPLVKVLARMEINGVSIDTDYLAELSGQMDRKLQGLTKKIY